MANEQNLKPWKPGQSGNPKGKPKGTKHLSTWIQELMEDKSVIRTIPGNKGETLAPIEAIIRTLIVKAVEGDVKAFDLLAKYGYGTKLDLTSKDLPMPILFGLNNSNTGKYIKNLDENNKN